ncbi:Hypothetical protein CAP_3320 [Chondromyces apiculatus DSM 436]|uniref:Uncharacterized protein n=1 Tax=Chondromyces apiculatus DSM 436 TaxID=1192034 RepID=A0A017T807_9BACT|nr:Hypothetical protein CAP_3320 [Chondromyces apiculatus DSM 436]
MMMSGRENLREGIREDNRQTQHGSPSKRSDVRRSGALPLQGAVSGRSCGVEVSLTASQAFDVIPGAKFLPGKKEIRTA